MQRQERSGNAGEAVTPVLQTITGYGVVIYFDCGGFVVYRPCDGWWVYETHWWGWGVSADQQLHGFAGVA